MWCWFVVQLCSGVDENAVGACAQLVFAPVDVGLSEDIPLLPSGFCVSPIDTSVTVRAGAAVGVGDGGFEWLFVVDYHTVVEVG